MKKVTIDGFRLSYPGTGLGIVTAELLRGFQELGYAKSINVIVEPSFNPQNFGLENLECEWINVELKPISPDYLGRLVWGRLVTKKLQEIRSPFQHFIPYFYNYGNIRENVVLVPDLIYKKPVPDTAKNPNQSWWNWRGKLPFRSLAIKGEELLVTQAKQLVVYTEFVKNELHQEIGVPLHKINIMQHPVPNWIISKYAESHNAKVQQKFRLPQRFIMYVGGFPPRKNIPMLLETCGKIFAKDPSFRCVLIGLTEQIIQTNWGISQQLENESVKNSTILLPNISYEDLASVYRLAEFTVYPSLNEGFGLPIIEAAASKKLCLCGNNSSMREVQTNPEYRIAGEAQNVWFEKIWFYWQNAELTKQIGEECEQLFHKYASRKSAEQLWNILQR